MRSDEEIQKSIQDGILEIVKYARSAQTVNADNTLSLISTNAVENKIVTAVLSELVEAIARYNTCDNLFDDKWIPGFYTTNGGGLIVSESTIAAKNRMNCYPGCNVHIEYGAVVGTIMCRFYDISDTFIHIDFYKNKASTADFVAPENAAYFRVSLYDSNGMTVENALELKVRTNTHFDELKNYIDTAISNLKAELTAPTNLFDINGEVDVNYSGEKQNLNAVSDGVLTCMANSSENHAVGQLINTEAGATYVFSGKVLSFGTSTSALACFYKGGTYENEVDETINELGMFSFEHVAASNSTLFAFATTDGTGAQFTDIKVVKK